MGDVENSYCSGVNRGIAASAEGRYPNTNGGRKSCGTVAGVSRGPGANEHAGKLRSTRYNAHPRPLMVAQCAREHRDLDDRETPKAFGTHFERGPNRLNTTDEQPPSLDVVRSR